MKMPVDTRGTGATLADPNLTMSTTEQPQQSLTPEQIPFHAPQMMTRYVTDTGKILPRKYTHLSAKQQREVTRTLKRSRNMLLSQ